MLCSYNMTVIFRVLLFLYPVKTLLTEALKQYLADIVWQLLISLYHDFLSYLNTASFDYVSATRISPWTFIRLYKADFNSCFEGTHNSKCIV